MAELVAPADIECFPGGIDVCELASQKLPSGSAFNRLAYHIVSVVPGRPVQVVVLAVQATGFLYWCQCCPDTLILIRYQFGSSAKVTVTACP